MKILIADDDPLSLRLMQRTLEKRGYQIVVVSDGRSAVKELTEPGGPKLALLDWMMPGLDGPEVCREVRRHQGDSYVYILLLTSRETTEDMVAGLESGADDYLTKPFKPAELNARLLTGRRILSLEEKLVEAREGMRFRATHDGLTGLLNRAAIVTRLQHALDTLPHGGERFALLLCDVDHFKKVNDLQGHNAGDAVLQEIGSRLREVARPLDCVGRYGGEEFLVLLWDADAASLASRAEEFRASIDARMFEACSKHLQVTVSIGAVAVTGEHGGLELREIVGCADQALYAAKSQGRNCVRLGDLPSLASTSLANREAVPLPGKPAGSMASLAERIFSTTLHMSRAGELHDSPKLAAI